MTILIVLAIIVAIIVFFCLIYRIADIDKALIITGGKEPIIKVSGGAFVIPIFRRAQYFDLCMLTVKADRDEIRTATSVPIVTDWTAQIRPDTSDPENLKKAIMSFKERGQDGIIQDVKLTLTGAVRDIVASMTPEAVLRDKAEFAQKVRDTVADEMKKMGMELVALNIQDISDKNGYYDNIAALDMEEKRLAAEKKHAEIEQAIRETKATSEQTAATRELASKLYIAEKKRDNDLQLAKFKAETDKANADAEIAGKLQQTIRMKEVTAEEGQIEVVRQEQANAAAIKEKEVIATKAEAEKERQRIDAEADAEVKRIEAKARVEVATNEANATKIAAEAAAEKVRAEGQAAADVTQQKGQAEADVIKKRGLAEASIEREKGIARAESEKALADARASHDNVNFEIEKLRIEADARITIATKTAELMAEVGKNAEFINIGGSATTQGQTGNVLLDTLSGIPGLMKVLNVENQALNGKPINEEVEGLVKSIAGPVKGVLATTVSPDAASDTNTTTE